VTIVVDVQFCLFAGFLKIFEGLFFCLFQTSQQNTNNSMLSNLLRNVLPTRQGSNNNISIINNNSYKHVHHHHHHHANNNNKQAVLDSIHVTMNERQEGEKEDDNKLLQRQKQLYISNNYHKYLCIFIINNNNNNNTSITPITGHINININNIINNNKLLSKYIIDDIIVILVEWILVISNSSNNSNNNNNSIVLASNNIVINTSKLIEQHQQEEGTANIVSIPYKLDISNNNNIICQYESLYNSKTIQVKHVINAKLLTLNKSINISNISNNSNSNSYIYNDTSIDSIINNNNNNILVQREQSIERIVNIRLFTIDKEKQLEQVKLVVNEEEEIKVNEEEEQNKQQQEQVKDNTTPIANTSNTSKIFKTYLIVDSLFKMLFTINTRVINLYLLEELVSGRITDDSDGMTSNSHISGNLLFYYINNNNCDISNVELSIMRVEQVNSNIFSSQVLIKHEILDGTPIQNQIIPYSLSLLQSHVLNEIISTTTTSNTSNNSNQSLPRISHVLHILVTDTSNRRYFRQEQLQFIRQVI